MDASNQKLHNVAFTRGLITPPETPKYSGSASVSSVKERHSRCTGGQDGKEPRHTDLGQVHELIYNIIEKAVEEKIAEAIGPLRLNLRRMDRENSDFHEQNDTLSRQIDLHYKSIQKQSEIFDSLSAAQAQGIQATSESLKTASHLVGHIAQTVTNLPSTIHQAVATSVQEQMQLGMHQLLAVQSSPQPAAQTKLNYGTTNTEQHTGEWYSNSSHSSASIGGSFTQGSRVFSGHGSKSSGNLGRESVRSKIARWFKGSRSRH